MKKVLAILMMGAGIVAGSAAMAAPYENSYSDYPEWAEEAFLPKD